MGIHGFMQLVKEFAPDALSEISVNMLHGKIVAVDASIMIYQMCSVGQTYNIKNADGKYINHIQGIFFRVVSMITRGMIPVFVFDGKPPEAKAATIQKRATNETTRKKIPREVFTEVQKLLTLMGVTIIMAPSEAEAQAAYYAASGFVDMVSTEDTDAVVFGAPLVVRGLDTNSSWVTLIDREKMLRSLALTKEMFVDLCILLGSDYSTKIPGIGPARALRLIREHKTIENIITAVNFVAPATFRPALARMEFLNPQVAPAPNGRPSLLPAKIPELKYFLLVIHGLESTRVAKGLAKLAEINQR